MEEGIVSECVSRPAPRSSPEIREINHNKTYTPIGIWSRISLFSNLKDNGGKSSNDKQR